MLDEAFQQRQAVRELTGPGESAGEAQLFAQPPVRSRHQVFAGPGMPAAGVRPQPRGMVLGRRPLLQEQLPLRIEHEHRERAEKVGLPFSVINKVSPDFIEDENIKIPATGDLVEGDVIGIDNNSVFIDLSPFGTGIIYGREFMNVRDVIKNLSIGDSIAAKIVEKKTKTVTSNYL